MNPTDCLVCGGTGRVITARRTTHPCPNGCEDLTLRFPTWAPVLGPEVPDSIVIERTIDEVTRLLTGTGK